MRAISWVFLILLAFATSAIAQTTVTSTTSGTQLDSKRWEVGASVGLLSTNPAPSDHPYANEWYFTGRYAASLARYWSEHFKTEIEIANTNAGERYVDRIANLPGVPTSYVYTVRERHTLRQVSGRTVWQFFDNAWVHPYVFGGVIYNADRVRAIVPSQWLYDPRSPNAPLIPSPLVNEEAHTVHRVGITAGAGAKFYMSPNAFFNTAVVMSHARPATTASLIGGFGVEF